jgi:hypothetical protein
MAITLNISAIEQEVKQEGVKPPRLLAEIKMLRDMLPQERFEVSLPNGLMQNSLTGAVMKRS